MIITLVDDAVEAGASRAAACDILGLSARTLERWRVSDARDDQRAGPRAVPRSKLSEKERRKVIETACSSEFRNKSPKQIVPILADRGEYIASESTLYRILHEEKMVNHRGRSKAPRPAPAKPKEKVATKPRQLWSWDITYLPGVIKGTFRYMYVIMDVWSRKIVGQAVHDEENTMHAAMLIDKACRDEGIERDDVTLHSDNGSPMKGATMLATLQKLGVAASFSRPSVSNDNPFSEALFRTAKYCLASNFKAFATLEDARAWADQFVQWYNHEHLHSSIGFVTPADRHDGRDIAILEGRRKVFEAARAAHPERWSSDIRSLSRIAEVTLNPDGEVTTKKIA